MRHWPVASNPVAITLMFIGYHDIVQALPDAHLALARLRARLATQTPARNPTGGPTPTLDSKVPTRKPGGSSLCLCPLFVPQKESCPLTFRADRLMNTSNRVWQHPNGRWPAEPAGRNRGGSLGRETRPKSRNFTAASKLNVFSIKSPSWMAPAPAPNPWKVLSAHTRRGEAEIEL